MNQTEQSTFVDERSHAIETSYISPVSPAVNRLPNSMGETQYDVRDLLKQEIKYSSFLWTVDDAQGKELLSISIPELFNSLSTIHKLQFNTFQFYRFTPVLRVQVNTTKFNSGRLMVVWDPLSNMQPTADTSAVSARHTTHLCQCSGYPNTQIDAKDSNTGFISIPFEHIISYFSASKNPVDATLPLGTVRIMCMNKLTAPDTASNSVGVAVYVKCADIEFHVPTRPHNVSFTTTAEAGIISTIGNTLSSGKGILNNLSTGNFSGAASGLGGLLKSFNLDKPAIPDAKVGNCLATVDPLAHMKGKADTPRLGATPTGGYLEEGFSSAPSSELIINEIIQKPMFVGTFAWSADQPENTVLATIPVTPALRTLAPDWKYSNTIQVTGPSGRPYSSNVWRTYPTYLNYLATMFEFWTGSVDFRFDIVSTSFHTGRLMLSFEPCALPDPIDTSITDNAFTNTPYQVFDLHESASTSLKCNYVSSTPRKSCDTYATEQPEDNSILGYLRVIVTSRLVAPEAVTQTVDVNCWLSAGEDFRFTVPRLNNNTMLTTDVSLLTIAPAKTIAEAAVLPTESDISTRTSDPKHYPGLVRGNPLVPTVDPFGENIDTVLDLARRYCREQELFLSSYSTQFGVGNSKRIQYYEAVFPITPTPGSTSGQLPTTTKLMDSLHYMKMIADMYVFWSGSIRFQFIPLIDRTIPLVNYVTYVPNHVTTSLTVATEAATASEAVVNSSFPSVVWNSSQDAAMQVEVPFYSKFNQCAVQKKGDSQGSYVDAFETGSIWYRAMRGMNTTDVNDNTLPLIVNSSIGDDFKFRFLIAPPVIRSNL